MTGRAVLIGTVARLYRYPVKSTAGQAVTAAPLGSRGLLHDREWAAYTPDGGIGSGKRTRRFRPVAGLMQWRSEAADEDRVPWLISPQGDRYRVDDPAASQALTHALGQPLTLRRETTIPHHDEASVHLITTCSIASTEALLGGTVDNRRVRPNIVLDTGPEPTWLEDDWAGASITIGAHAMLRIGPGMTRCVMLDQPQVGVRAEPAALQILGRAHNLILGVQAGVTHPGVIRAGDPAVLMHNV